MIRPATPADLSVIERFIRALAGYEKLAHEVRFDSAVLAEHLFGARPMAEVLIAETDGAPVGFALFFHSFSTFEGRPGIYLEDLFVLPEARGAGHGRALLAMLARLAVERGCARLDWQVLDWNEPSKAFYRSLGARHGAGWEPFRLEGDSLSALAAEAR